MSVMRFECGRGGLRRVAVFTAAASLLATIFCSGCTPRGADSAATPLPTRQSTIDPVKQKLDAAQQEAERRRNEAERAGQ